MWDIWSSFILWIFVYFSVITMLSRCIRMLSTKPFGGLQCLERYSKLCVNRDPGCRSFSHVSNLYRVYSNKVFTNVCNWTREFQSHLNRQVVAVTSQRCRKRKFEEFIKHIHNNVKLKQLMAKLKAILHRNAIGLSRSRAGLLLSGVAFQWNCDNDTLERISSEMSMLSASQEKPSEKLDNVLQKSKWEKSIDLPHLVGWRRPVDDNSGLYEYKLFCRFYDVSAKSFYESQVDLDYRKQWDDRVISLDIVDKDQKNKVDVLRWVTRFPWPMAPREYIFVRKSLFNEEDHTILLLQHSVTHPEYPEGDNKSTVRVEHYTSDWIIRPHSSYEEDGFDFIFTYFDDPKGSYPSSAVKWIANKGVPGYVETMHDAAKKYQESKKTAKGQQPSKHPNVRQQSDSEKLEGNCREHEQSSFRAQKIHA